MPFKCGQCGAMVPDGRDFCPQCDADVAAMGPVFDEIPAPSVIPRRFQQLCLAVAEVFATLQCVAVALGGYYLLLRGHWWIVAIGAPIGLVNSLAMMIVFRRVREMGARGAPD